MADLTIPTRIFLRNRLNLIENLESATIPPERSEKKNVFHVTDGLIVSKIHNGNDLTMSFE